MAAAFYQSLGTFVALDLALSATCRDERLGSSKRQLVQDIIEELLSTVREEYLDGSEAQLLKDIAGDPSFAKVATLLLVFFINLAIFKLAIWLVLHQRIHRLLSRAFGVLLATRVGQAIQARVSGLLHCLNLFLGPFYAMADPLAKRLHRPFLPPPGIETLLVFMLITLGLPIAYTVCFLITPLAILALIVRNIRSCLTRPQHLLKTKKPSATDTAPFRLLDMPPEVRNQVYCYAAKSALKTSASIASSRPRAGKIDPERDTPQDTFRNLLVLSHASSRTAQTSRFALLLASRQVNREASGIYYFNMRLNLESCFLRSSLEKMARVVNMCQPKLQFIRHLEMEMRVAINFLFVRSKPGLPKFESLHEDDKELLSYRHLFTNIEKVTIFPNHKGNTVLEDLWDITDRQSVGLPTLYQLASSTSRACLADSFPYLGDIVAANRFGSERFRKRESGLWELWYSRTLVPAERKEEDDILAALGGLYDLKTRLTTAQVLDWIGR